MLTTNPELAALLAAATTKAEWLTALKAALGSTRRVVCAHNGTVFRDCALTGTMSDSGTALTGLGVTSGTTVAQAADLSTGTATLRIDGSGHHIQGALGLSGSGADFILSANPTASNGLAFGTVAITAPAALPDGGVPPPADTTAPTVSIAVAATNIVTASGLLLTATASDNVGVDRVEFYRGATFLGTVNAAPFTFTDNLTNAQNGTHTYTAKAYDAASNSTTSSPSATVTVNIPAPAGVLATMMLANTSASPVSRDFIPPMFGHPFKMGDIPAGHYPKFELADSTNVPYTMFNTRTWSDGSLKFASFLIRVPTTVAGSGSVAILVRNTTATPAASSSRALADLSSGGTDLKVELAGLENLSGTWTSSLNQGISDADDIVTFGDGDVGKVWRIRQQFMQSSANHGQLECYWYVAALQDSNGNLYGLRYLGRVCQPWYDVDVPAKTHRLFSDFQVKNGVTVLRNAMTEGGFGTPVPFSYDGHAYNLVATNHGQVTGTAARFSGTQLPSPLVSDTTHVLYKVDANTVRASTGSTYILGGDPGATLSGAASGDATFTTYPMLAHFGSLWTCGADTKWDFLQAGGSAIADATVRIQHNADYWRQTWVVPPYSDIVVDAQADYNYRLNGMGPITQYTDTTGERDDLGILPSWHARHFLRQGATEEKVSRLVGLAAGQVHAALYNSSTKTLPNVKGNGYTGLPTVNTELSWTGDASSGFTAPTGIKNMGMSHINFAHMPAMAYYPYLFSGEPQFLDLVLEWGSLAVVHRYAGATIASDKGNLGPRNTTVSGVAYNGITIGDGGTLREDAWSTRDLGFAAGIVPDSAPQCPAYKSYFSALYADSFDALKRWLDNLAPTFLKTMGGIHFRSDTGGIGAPWMHNYFVAATALTGKLNEDTNALAVLDHALKYYDFVKTNFSGWHIGTYRTLMRTGDTGSDPYIPSIDYVAFYRMPMTWTAAGSLLTFADTTYAGYILDGDKIIFDLNDNNAAPAGLSNFTPYYVINKSGVNFQLAATPGGAPLAITGDGSGGSLFTASNAPATGAMEDVSTAGSMAGALAAVNIGKAAGGTIAQATIDDVEFRMSSVNFAPNPKNRIAASI